MTDGQGTAGTQSAYPITMQYVGTLSWGMTAPTVERAFGRSRTPATATVPAAGQRGIQCASITMGANPLEAEAANQAPRASRATLANLAGRTEVKALEQDWTQIVYRCMNGDSGAWAEMVRTHQRRVYGLCYRFTGNATDAEDLTQDVFLKIYSNLGSFDSTRGSLPVWITTMTRNLLVDNYRRTRNQRATGSLDEGWDQTEELRPHLSVADRLADTGPSPHESAARQELKKMVQKALMKVSVELREAVILRDLQDLDYKEIAQVLGIPEGTVKSRISRGRAELARLLERSKKEVM
ncbi:MAG: sigma-70 family RNA polymerase sigma factor [Terracidiphilus sp.]